MGSSSKFFKLVRQIKTGRYCRRKRKLESWKQTNLIVSRLMIIIRRRWLTVNRGCCLIMTTTIVLMKVLRLGHWWIDLHVLKLFICRRHQLLITAHQLLLCRMLLLLGHNDLVHLLVMLVGKRRIAGHEHDVLRLWWERLRCRSGSWRWLRAGVESLLMGLTRRRSCGWWRRNQVLCELCLCIVWIGIHSNRRWRICLRWNWLHLLGMMIRLYHLLSWWVEDRLASRLSHLELVEF